MGLYATIGRLAAAAGLSALCSVALPFPAPGLAADVFIRDDFEGEDLDRSRWWLGQIHDLRRRMDRNERRAGRQSLAIRVEGGDRHACGEDCERSEIRVHPGYWLNFGTEAWYGFSFRVSGRVDQRNSSRLVIGQWKDQSNGSPFLAQRFDNRVFHITVQDNECRALVAQAKGDIAEHLDEIEAMNVTAFTFLSDPELYRCRPNIEVTYGPGSELPDPFDQWVDMVYQVRGGRDGKGRISIWANGVHVATVEGSIGHDKVAGPAQYFKFGLYRDKADYATTIHLDNFRRGSSYADVDPAR